MFAWVVSASFSSESLRLVLSKADTIDICLSCLSVDEFLERAFLLDTLFDFLTESDVLGVMIGKVRRGSGTSLVMLTGDVGSGSLLP